MPCNPHPRSDVQGESTRCQYFFDLESAFAPRGRFEMISKCAARLHCTQSQNPPSIFCRARRYINLWDLVDSADRRSRSRCPTQSDQRSTLQRLTILDSRVCDCTFYNCNLLGSTTQPFATLLATLGQAPGVTYLYHRGCPNPPPPPPIKSANARQ